MDTSINWTGDRFPFTTRWVCPYCSEGRLELDASRLHIEEYEYSKNKHGNYEVENSEVEVESCCAGILKCNYCGELVSFCGTARGEDIEYDEPSSPTGTAWVYCHVIKPLFVHPSLYFIKMSNHYPKTVTTHLQESFRLFWVDKMSCANKLRVVVEDILNHFRVKRTSINKKNKRYKLSTHNRLNIFKQISRFSEPAKYLLAVNKIGNVGSHTGSFDDKTLEPGFDSIEKALNILFIKSDEKLRKTCELIIKTKGRSLNKFKEKDL